LTRNNADFRFVPARDPIRHDALAAFRELRGYRAPDRTRLFTVRRGQTVRDVYTLVREELAERLHNARLWREGIDGRQVGRYHAV
jgi:hypothetical protein